jgi:hypothetical protein
LTALTLSCQKRVAAAGTISMFVPSHEQRGACHFGIKAIICS